ncbi:DUF1800 domain-containing protein [Thiofilum flexile]|uniref:DUF1800 domain-containing protein n=1 Tax=Thiofilum flexile TaxID=125627 RepID=UPI00037CD401|nr:DUF1800 domain-containing protein [Thiofilum flexile]
MQVLTFSDARHLVARTGLGAEWETIQRLVGKPRAVAVDLVLNQPISLPGAPPAMSPWNKLEPLRQVNPQGRKQAWVIAQQEGKLLQGWWLNHLIRTRSPVVERMTLFWHGLFTSSIQKTLQPSFLYKQNVLLRHYALGNFRYLLHEIAKDPAMLVYLDGHQNMRSSPNENFARELLELFTLGRGYYRESDVKAATQAFTGWSLDPNNGTFVKRPDQHSSKRVTFLGRTGQFDGDEIIDILLQHPRTAEHIVTLLWREFINPVRLDQGIIRHLAQAFRQSDYDIRALMRALLNHEAFWVKYNRGTITKSPIEILIGTIRMVPYPQEGITELVNLCRLLGQELFDPPNVKGWAGDQHWVNSQTLLVRTSYLTKLSRGNLNRRVFTGLDLPQTSNERLQEWMLAVPAVNPLPRIPGDRRLVRGLLLDPAFQVV